MLFSEKYKRLNLALQGGGAHGAFTWGVLDRLLQEGDIEPSWISATSAGAFNAVAVAHGLATGGPEVARTTLQALWSAVERARVPDLVRLNPLVSSFGGANLSGVFSPYNFNPLGFDPLRKILVEHIDFDAIRKSKAVQLRIAATDVATGRARLFQSSEMTVEMVLASACLPTLHHAVEIDGRAYWDGGFSANPDLISLINESAIGDTLLVLLNPLVAPIVPKTAADIEDRVNTITFNQPLLRDVDQIVRAQVAPQGWLAGREPEIASVQRHRFHLIDAAQHTANLSAGSKATPDREMLQQLFAAGLSETESWLSANKNAVGRRSTVDLRSHFLESHNMPVETLSDTAGSNDTGPVSKAG